MGLLEWRVRDTRVGMRVRGGGSEVQSRSGDRTMRGTPVGTDLEVIVRGGLSDSIQDVTNLHKAIWEFLTVNWNK